mmetsp:Transcript_15923/g.30070  ORF Transcript_15923/g.30070 Transcript_15923/m.30070 type:complete len:540 (-) Transcript_15923:105-1724(-)
MIPGEQPSARGLLRPLLIRGFQRHAKRPGGSHAADAFDPPIVRHFATAGSGNIHNTTLTAVLANADIRTTQRVQGDQHVLHPLHRAPRAHTTLTTIVLLSQLETIPGNARHLIPQHRHLPPILHQMLHKVTPHHARPRLDHRMLPVGIVEFLAGPRHRLAIVGEVALHLMGIGLPSFETVLGFRGGGFLGTGRIEGGEGLDETGGSEGVFGVVVVGRRRRQWVVVRIAGSGGGTVDGTFEIGGFDHARELSPQRAHSNFPPRNDEGIPHRRRRRRRLILLFSSVIFAIRSIAHHRSASCTTTVILVLLILPFHFHGSSSTNIIATATNTTASSILPHHLNLVMMHRRPLHLPSLAHIRLDLAPIQLPEPVHSRNVTMANPALILRQHVEEGGHAGGKGGGIDRFSFLLLGAQYACDSRDIVVVVTGGRGGFGNAEEEGGFEVGRSSSSSCVRPVVETRSRGWHLGWWRGIGSRTGIFARSGHVIDAADVIIAMLLLLIVSPPSMMPVVIIIVDITSIGGIHGIFGGLSIEGFGAMLLLL